MTKMDFQIIMLSAWHEQFGNGLLRMFDGHKSLYTYPFESQISTPLSGNMVAGPLHWVPQRYAYPEFPSEISPVAAYQSLWDQELKTYLRTPNISKFKDCGILMDERKRVESFLRHSEKAGRTSRALFIEAFFRSTFDAWENYPRTGKETHYVGYSPPIIFDADKFFSDFPRGHMVHIIRNPFSGFADTIKRPFPFSLVKYCQIWNAAQLLSQVYKNKYKDQFHVIFAEDLFANKRETMEGLLNAIGLPWDDHALAPTFAGRHMTQVYPWGTVKYPTTEANVATAAELTFEQHSAILVECLPVLEMLLYKNRFDYVRKS